MRIDLEIEGIQDAQKIFKKSAEILAGTRGRFYDHQDQLIKKAIVANADSSYTGSPAVDVALESVNQPWEHQGKWHIKSIMAPTYANYRQYGCGGLKIAELVRFTPSDIQEMLLAAVEDLKQG